MERLLVPAALPPPPARTLARAASIGAIWARIRSVTSVRARLVLSPPLLAPLTLLRRLLLLDLVTHSPINVTHNILPFSNGEHSVTSLVTGIFGKVVPGSIFKPVALHIIDTLYSVKPVLVGIAKLCFTAT